MLYKKHKIFKNPNIFLVDSDWSIVFIELLYKCILVLFGEVPSWTIAKLKVVIVIYCSPLHFINNKNDN